MRADLLSLSADDLASISNRGNVNRATRELDQGKVNWNLNADAGTVVVEWSDGPTTTIPADAIVSEAICTCPATSVCRHIVRTVLAYQRWANEHSGASVDAPSEPWDPGAIADDALASSFRGASLSRWETVFREPPGLVVELVRSAKPTARFHRLGHTIRFLVPNDARYTRCDCDEPAPCRHVPLAAWAFRELPADRSSGVVETLGPEAPLPAERLAPLLDIARRFVRDGIAETPNTRIDRLRTQETQLRTDGLLWPAETVRDVLRQWEHYHQHDARFSPSRVAELMGELVIRHDALVAEPLPVPRLFVRGEDRESRAKLGQTKLVGLGTAAVPRHGAVDLVAILQDTKSGKVMSFVETFPDPPEGSPRHTASFAELARRPVFDSRDFATLGRSQVVVKSVRLNPDHTLSIGRSPTSAYGQDYRWDDLLAPLLCETVAELRARIDAQPPASLRPRRIGEDLVVLPVSDCLHPRFDSRTQSLRATLIDSTGESVELAHPFSSRGRSGLERALQWLSSSSKLVYVSARGRYTARGLVLAPTALVFEDGSHREMVQPWVDDMDAHLERATVSVDAHDSTDDPLDDYRAELADTLGSTLVVGIEQRDTARFAGLSSRAEELGLSTHLRSLESLVLQADTDAFLELLVASSLARELG